MLRLFAIILLTASLQGCAGVLIGTAADATIAVAKIPFKVGAAVVDVISDDED